MIPELIPIYILIFAFGIVIGSFLNAVSYTHLAHHFEEGRPLRIILQRTWKFSML